MTRSSSSPSERDTNVATILTKLLAQTASVQGPRCDRWWARTGSAAPSGRARSRHSTSVVADRIGKSVSSSMSNIAHVVENITSRTSIGIDSGAPLGPGAADARAAIAYASFALSTSMIQ
jgi:hypothetical protein